MVQFLNLINSNVINKADQMGYELNVTKAQLSTNEIQYKNKEGEIGILFPIHLPDGEVIDIVILTQKNESPVTSQ